MSNSVGTYRKELLQLAKDMGWSVRITRGGHYALSKDGVVGTVFCASSPSDHRALANTRHKLRMAERTGRTNHTTGAKP